MSCWRRSPRFVAHEIRVVLNGFGEFEDRVRERGHRDALLLHPLQHDDVGLLAIDLRVEQ